MNARTPIHLPTRLLDVRDLLAEHLIGSAMLARWSLSPRVIATERHPERLIEDADRILLPILFHDLVPHSWPCEKLLTVFFLGWQAYLDGKEDTKGRRTVDRRERLHDGYRPCRDV
jgi:hypothetical protein